MNGSVEIDDIEGNNIFVEEYFSTRRVLTEKRDSLANSMAKILKELNEAFERDYMNSLPSNNYTCDNY